MPTAPDPATRTRDLHTLYDQHHRALQRRIAARVHAPTATIEDACQTAWTKLCARPDIDPSDEQARGWLYVVALHEAYALSRQTAGTPPDVDTAEDVDRIEQRLEHLDRLPHFHALKPAERTALVLQAAGHSYKEIGQLTHATHTAVNRRVNEGRARLRANTGR